jgi:hypothetical protein
MNHERLNKAPEELRVLSDDDNEGRLRLMSRRNEQAWFGRREKLLEGSIRGQQLR